MVSSPEDYYCEPGQKLPARVKTANDTKRGLPLFSPLLCLNSCNKYDMMSNNLSSEKLLAFIFILKKNVDYQLIETFRTFLACREPAFELNFANRVYWCDDVWKTMWSSLYSTKSCYTKSALKNIRIYKLYNMLPQSKLFFAFFINLTEILKQIWPNIHSEGIK